MVEAPAFAIATPPPVLIAPPPPAPIVHRHVAHRAHSVVHHPVVHRHYAMRTRHVRIGTPMCGTTEHPCNVEHLTAPIQ
jgi:hypothetical protein